jgi:hypothetical protein
MFQNKARHNEVHEYKYCLTGRNTYLVLKQLTGIIPVSFLPVFIQNVSKKQFL